MMGKNKHLSNIYYKELGSYKYILNCNYTIKTNIKPQKTINSEFIVLTTSGILTIKKFYVWNGPITKATTFMRASLVHEAFYQLIREEYLRYKENRILADKILQTICLEDGMPKYHTKYFYIIVRIFGGPSAKPPLKPTNKIIYAT